MGQALSWCQVALQELSHPVLASPAHPHPEISGSKAKWDERSCQAGGLCHGCDEQKVKWVLLIHTKGFPPLIFGRMKGLEGVAINPPRVCLHWTPSELIVLNVWSNLCSAQQLEGLEMVDHIIWHFLHIFLTSHTGKLNWGKPFHVQWGLKVFRIYPTLDNPRNSPKEVADSSVLSKIKLFNNIELLKQVILFLLPSLPCKKLNDTLT